MLIMITNDDGYDAAGLWVLYDLAHKIAGKSGRVVVIAPHDEQSGVSHSVSYLSPISYTMRREDHYTVHGTPADCVLLAEQILGQKPDLVLSGVNRGHNLGPDLLYSGTVGAAIEATAQGIPAVALSQFYGKTGAEIPFSSARAFGLQAISPVLRKFLPNWPEGKFCNINFPACSSEEVKGIRLVPAEALSKSNMTARKQMAPNGREYFWLGHPGPLQAREDNKDVALCKNGHVVTSFCHLNLSDDEFIAANSNLYEV